MTQTFDPVQNYEDSKKAIGYVNRKEATQADYDRIGFMSGLEVHQQLLTKRKLFCRCPAGIYNQSEDYDAEVIRHMRPTLSELGEYDGTALMEFKTRKNIVYRIKNETACTYEVDDTPPFPIDPEALEKALEISILSNLNIVGEVHITRKQYLDGSIPTGFQRTAILGVEGEIQLKHKKIRLIQLSIEEDSCREVSDIGHWRIYKTDRLGMPLIETVTYPEFMNPDEVKEGADYIRFLNRSTGKVRTGVGSTRADVNVSCKGGTRVEIKGVAHTNWMPELTHIEAFRQFALLNIRTLLNNKVKDTAKWNLSHIELTAEDFKYSYEPLIQANKNNNKIIAIKLPQFKGILSHFTQPTKIFADEISDRLKVIACIEKPNMLHSEKLEKVITESNFEKVNNILDVKEDDAWIVFWGPEEDIPTALETVEERCRMAFEGVPNETRKSFIDGSTIFERVLPGADRMYPDTDTAPIPLKDEFIENIRKNLPMDIHERIAQLQSWSVPYDTYTFILKRNLVPLMEKINKELGISYPFIGTFIGHKLKFVENNFECPQEFNYEKLYDLFKYMKDNNLDLSIAKNMLIEYYQHPKLDFDSVLTYINFKPVTKEEIIEKIPFLKEKFKEIKYSEKEDVDAHWIMGQVAKMARGNIRFSELKELVDSQ
ncbi:MAG: Glu-tRNA(Gln) amidotransferase subunit GatE [Bacteroidetes bacterium]|jgi:glutamyl-tRNA(Gln) amidotransferase subunit E|nr:Glu-tRNA(Gln) amidotransferase subunit GatE [Bacteroidota bacterium]MBT3934942.1 Glu-tRNA(Gln) amidotransferase subunit GatE [Bacteroidota bacterium]MBT4969430.1 Glu-tRNA(Gln) amidotransferase subunit GatE [Bacteroidota bacterium]MBT5990756.1 Glu-tRNA(Gln) amidotransferase subunit GatE [Bacteroidota bacterium]MBT6835547.1 Glu-tRNA(Gln) amidotransferase subunit GatE [Bacteroidota bacterium]